MYSVARFQGNSYLAKYKDKTYVLAYYKDTTITLTCTLDGGFFPPQQIVTINGVEYSSGRGGVTYLLHGYKGTSEILTVVYDGETLTIPVTYAQGNSYTLDFSSIKDGNASYTADSTVEFTVPKGITKIKLEAVAIQSFSGNITRTFTFEVKSGSAIWGSENVIVIYGKYRQSTPINTVINVTPLKSYSLTFTGAAYTTGFNLSWGKEINELDATVSDL